jgi:flagella basal body P-ring formation protein FlgA
MNSRTLLFLLLSAGVVCYGARAYAQGADAAALSGGNPSTEPVRAFVTAEVARSQPNLRAEITVGEVDSHLHLAACERTEAFLRPGTRLWGRTYVGFRCTTRPNWSISIPVEVRLFGPGFVAARALPANTTIGQSDLRVADVEVTSEQSGVVVEVAQAEDHVTTRAVDGGQPIPLNALRTVPVIGQGDPVKLVGTGSGFSISTDGVALSNAADGESVRVRTDSGHTLSGIARKNRVVEVNF